MTVSALERLSEASGREFPNLLAARERTRLGLDRRRQSLSDLDADADVAIVLMGSWGRAEVTSESDDDFMVLVRGVDRPEVRPSVEAVSKVLDKSPGTQGTFGQLVASTPLIERIGLEEDPNSNHTRRMLLLLESVPAAGEAVHEAVRSAAKSTRAPRSGAFATRSCGPRGRFSSREVYSRCSSAPSINGKRCPRH